MAPGLHNSMVRPSVPSVSSRYATCGCATAVSTRSDIVISITRVSAPARASLVLAPLNRFTVRPSSFFMRSATSVATMSMSGGEALSASCSVKDRLSTTACSTSVTFRPRCVASVRAYAAVSEVAFFDITSSIFSPFPVTGCAAPMWVPGAIAAMSAAMVIRNPAEAARLPDGPTKMATGVRAAMMALLMSRVESRSPPGVRSVNTISRAPSASAVAIALRMNSDVTGWMMPSTVALSTMGARSSAGGTPAAGTPAAAISNPAISSNVPRMTPPGGPTFGSGLLTSLFNALEHPPRIRQRRIDLQRALDFDARVCHVLDQKVRLSERDPAGRGILAPDRDLQRVDGLSRAAVAQVNAADQQVRLRLVRREEYGAAQLGQCFGVLLALEEPATAVQVEPRKVLLIALRRVDDGPVDRLRPARLEIRPRPLQPLGHGVGSPSSRSFGVLRRQLRGELALADCLRPASRCFQLRREHHVRVAIGGVTSQRFTQPVDRPLRIAVQGIGVSHVEQEVRIVRLGVRRLGEVVSRLPRVCRRPASHLDDTQIVEDGCARRLVLQRLQRGERLVILPHPEQGDCGKKAGSTRRG